MIPPIKNEDRNLDIKQHYDNLLADIYSWMSGDFTEKVNQTLEFFIKNNIKPSSTLSAIDLGSGHGIQSAALLDIGFDVTAVDLSKKLLDELKQNTANKVKSIHGDIMEFSYPGEIKPELIVCMGDTLTHLPSADDVKRVVAGAAENLAEGGKLILSFRDLSAELKGNSRFIPVKSETNRILTCFLEYGTEKVTVYDILHELENGKWQMKVSSYNKIRLSAEGAEKMINAAGLRIIHSEKISGMDHIISQKLK